MRELRQAASLDMSHSESHTADWDEQKRQDKTVKVYALVKEKIIALKVDNRSLVENAKREKLNTLHHKSVNKKLQEKTLSSTDLKEQADLMKEVPEWRPPPDTSTFTSVPQPSPQVGMWECGCFCLFV